MIMDDNQLIINHLDRLQGKTALIIGDVMLDKYVIGEVHRISPEAPIPILSDNETSQTTGGAANVGGNLAQLGCQVSLVGCVGVDSAATELSSAISLIPQLTFCPVSCADRRTTVKMRFLSSGQQLLRVDSETTSPVNAAQEAIIFSHAQAILPQSSVLILSDYAKGCLTKSLIENLITLARAEGVPVIIDPKSADFSYYRGADFLTPNLSELKKATGLTSDTPEAIEFSAKKLLDDYQIGTLLVTMGARGMMLVNANECVHLPAHPCEVFDVSGAGDTVIALLASAHITGLADSAAACLANLGASLVVAKRGTASLALGELIAVNAAPFGDISLPYGLDKIRGWRAGNQIIGFTNGCFDLLHPGHFECLKAAARSCDKLIVGLNSDASLKRLKGSTRPIQHELIRARILAALPFIDQVILFDEDTPENLIKNIKPDMLIKGGDYQAKDIAGHDFVIQNGGKVSVIKLVEGYSTSRFLQTGAIGLY